MRPHTNRGRSPSFVPLAGMYGHELYAMAVAGLRITELARGIRLALATYSQEESSSTPPRQETSQMK